MSAAPREAVSDVGSPHAVSAAEILTLQPRLGSVRLVAVDGPAGAGKTTYAAALLDKLSAAGVDTVLVPTDHFATWDNPVAWWPELEAGVLRPLAAGEAGSYRRNEWSNGVPGPGPIVEVPLPQVLLVEGVSSARRAVASRLSLAVWIDGGTESERLERAITRDGEAERDHLRRWQLFERGWFAVDGTEARCVSDR